MSKVKLSAVVFESDLKDGDAPVWHNMKDFSSAYEHTKVNAKPGKSRNADLAMLRAIKTRFPKATLYYEGSVSRIKTNF